jgi:hypothetical protein
MNRKAYAMPLIDMKVLIWLRICGTEGSKNGVISAAIMIKVRGKRSLEKSPRRLLDPLAFKMVLFGSRQGDYGEDSGC